MIPSRRSVARSIRRQAETIAEDLRVVLTQARCAAARAELPWRAAEHAWRTRHPHHARGRMVVLDEESARLVLRVLGNLGRKVHRKAWHVLGLRFLKCVLAGLIGEPIDERGLDRIVMSRTKGQGRENFRLGPLGLPMATLVPFQKRSVIGLKLTHPSLHG